MAVTAHAFPSLDLNAMKESGGGTASTPIKLQSDTLQVLLVASSSPAYTWNATSQGHTTVTNFLAGSGAGALTEVTGGGYARQTLGSVTITNNNNVTTLTCGNINWTTVTFSATYAAFFDNTVGGTDSTNQLICYWDFGGTQSVSAANFTLTISGSGLVTWTNS